ncbi:hypothetical protein ACRQ5D_19010 [Mucilaginibacter sp. P25]|uniref:hypothetical protein n=1 Tax=Mucilaginibacter sp. P25 TaxID=3423945 RepID=UPI003D7930ED
MISSQSTDGRTGLSLAELTGNKEYIIEKLLLRISLRIGLDELPVDSTILKKLATLILGESANTTSLSATNFIQVAEAFIQSTENKPLLQSNKPITTPDNTPETSSKKKKKLPGLM